jgi:2-polyprenyl-3-methyl-5-hydroxy-6-metoxy-1,4-benzoquinol methylase
MVQAPCQLCESQTAEKLFEKKGYAHLQCSRCGSVYVFPRPQADELVDFYNQELLDHLSQSCWQDSHKHAWGLWQRTLNVAQTKGRPGKLLDIGCGTGEFMRFAQQSGWQGVEGVEVIPKIADYARAATGATIHTTDFLNADLESGSYGVIALWDVIEHLSDVKASLRAIYRLLKPGGVVIIGTVNCQGFSIRALKHRAQTFSPPEHLTFFTQKGMRSALASQGFRILEQSSAFIYLQEWTRFLPRGNANADPQGGAKTRAKLTDSYTFLFFMEWLNGILWMSNLGDELVAIAQKPEQA